MRSHFHGHLAALAALLLGCGGDEPPTPTTLVEIQAPSSLTLDGQAISGGRFTLTEVTAYIFGDTTMTSETVLEAGAPPIVKQTVIGDTTVHPLFEIPATAKALELRGYFVPTSPSLPNASFHLTVFGEFTTPLALTVFLPENTSESTNQITGTGTDVSLGDNVNTFSDEEIPPATYPTIVNYAFGGAGNIDVTVYPLNFPTSRVPMQPHGTVRLTPVEDDDFMCGGGNGSVDPSVVCNGVPDCSNGADEDFGLCTDEASCCVATNGCPAETGTSCAATCCCCGAGQACDVANPSNGCIPSN